MRRQMRIVGLPDPLSEYQFAESRKWRFDFAWPEFMLAVEVEGGQWLRGADGQRGGRHNRAAGLERDCEKYNAAAMAGWRVLRFTGDMVEDGRAVSTVERAVAICSARTSQQQTGSAGAGGPD